MLFLDIYIIFCQFRLMHKTFLAPRAPELSPLWLLNHCGHSVFHEAALYSLIITAVWCVLTGRRSDSRPSMLSEHFPSEGGGGDGDGGVNRDRI